MDDSTARSQAKPGEASQKTWRNVGDVSTEEYLQAAQKTGKLKGMARYLNVAYSSMCGELARRDIKAHCMNLFPPDTKKPGARNVPPLPAIEGAGPDPEWDVEAIKKSAMRRYDANEARATKKDKQEIRFAHGPIALIFLGDQHIGNPGSDVRRMYEERQMILDTPGAFVWQMGDVVDNFIVGRLMAENFKESLPIMEQWILAKDYFEGFAERLLAFCGGNHEAWTQKLSGIDYRRDITPDGVLYDGDTIKATISVGDMRFRIWSRHKWQGSSLYNPTHGNERGARFDSPDFDIYVGAHLHKGGVAREFIHNRKRRMSILAGTYKMTDDYAIEKGFPHHDASTAVALVLHDTGTMFACADLLAVKQYMQKCYPEEAA